MFSHWLVCVWFLYVFFFFFKQKTAYEMRISDWSSDVCSSDLAEVLKPGIGCGDARQHVAQPTGDEVEGCGHDVLPCLRTALSRRPSLVWCHSRSVARRRRRFLSQERCALLWQPLSPWQGAWGGSEEHTSELPSLMRSSYAVFCLNK